MIVFDSSKGQSMMDLNSFKETFNGGVRVSTGDLDADGQADVIASGNGSTATTLTINTSGQYTVGNTFTPFNSSALVRSTVADVNGDGVADASFDHALCAMRFIRIQDPVWALGKCVAT